MALASGKLISLTQKESKRAQLVNIVKARRAAARVECVYRILRAHALANRGHITKEVLQELAG